MMSRPKFSALLRRAPDAALSMRGRNARLGRQRADAGGGLARIGHHAVAAGPAGVALRDLGQGAVRIEARDVIVQRARERADAAVVVDEAVQVRALAVASSAVSPTTTKAAARIFRWAGSRPIATMRPFTSA